MPEPVDMRQRILQEATRLFADRGYQGTSIQAVADAVGIRKPSLLYHFSSKEKLRRQVIEAQLTRWKSEIPRLMTQARGGQDRFASTVMALVGFFQEDSARARLVLREVLDRPQATEALIQEQLQPMASLVTDYIRLGQQAGRVRQDVDPESYVLEIVVMALGTAAVTDVAGALFPQRASQQRRVAELVRIARESLFEPHSRRRP